MLKLPPPLWAILLLAGLYYLSDLTVFSGLPDWRQKPAGLIVLFAGLALPALAIAQFNAAGTQVLPTSPTNNTLVVGGLYALTRNPMYLGLVIASLGAGLWFGRPLMLFAPALLFAIANWVFIPFEEAKMARQFGAEFGAYCKRVRRWI
jgi:protein-S-isoprenylcysteine O-methyltransferase Ste14